MDNYDPELTAKFIELAKQKVRCDDIEKKMRYLRICLNVGEYNPHPGKPSWDYPIMARHITRTLRLKLLKFEYAYKCIDLDF